MDCQLTKEILKKIGILDEDEEAVDFAKIVGKKSFSKSIGKLSR